jgi:alkylation response protein AidB-like acyl-CoA dehydrogenase
LGESHLKAGWLKVDFELTSEQQMVRALAREFAAREIAPYAASWDRSEELDRTIVAKLAAVGFLGALIPADYGGQGLDHVSYCLVIEELGRADSSVRGVVSVSLGLVAKSIARWGTEEQKRKWLPGLSAGSSLGCFGLTEPSTGSDAANLQSRATRDRAGWSISGEKMFITNGTWADIALIFARTGGTGPKGITAFIVPTTAPGFSTKRIKGKLGLRAQDTAELYLDEVRVPDDARLGGVGEGFWVAMAALDNGRMSLASGSVGIAQAALDSATSYAKSRIQFGKPIASFQLIQELLADMYVELEAARLLAFRVALLADAGRKHTVESSVAKYYASEVAVRASNAALQVFGGYGYVDEYPVGKYVRDARVMTLYEGTSQMHKLLIGRALTDISAFT